MEDKLILRGMRNCFEQDPEYFGKMLSIYKKHICWVASVDSEEILIHPFLCQLWEGRDITIIEEDLICSLIWQKIVTNKIIYRIQETPHCHPDNCIKENDGLLKSYITRAVDSKIIEAEFWGGTQGEDGFILFSEPPLSKVHKFPVEIGYAKPSQIYYHLFLGGRSLARLPYNSNYIIYFENIEEDWLHQA